MRHLRHRVVVDDRHLDVVDHRLLLRPHLIYMENLVRQLLVHQYVVQIRHLLVDVNLQDVRQNQDEQNLDEVLTFQDVAAHRLDVVVDVELRHL
jgi:hypothetical protein